MNFINSLIPYGLALGLALSTTVSEAKAGVNDRVYFIIGEDVVQVNLPADIKIEAKDCRVVNGYKVYLNPPLNFGFDTPLDKMDETKIRIFNNSPKCNDNKPKIIENKSSYKDEKFNLLTFLGKIFGE